MQNLDLPPDHPNDPNPNQVTNTMQPPPDPNNNPPGQLPGGTGQGTGQGQKGNTTQQVLPGGANMDELSTTVAGTLSEGNANGANQIVLGG